MLGSRGEGAVSEAEFLQPGRRQLAAGYVLYGPSVMLVLTLGKGVVMFTYEPKSGEYLLTEAEVSIARECKEFAINMSNQRHWHPAMDVAPRRRRAAATRRAPPSGRRFAGSNGRTPETPHPFPLCRGSDGSRSGR